MENPRRYVISLPNTTTVLATVDAADEIDACDVYARTLGFADHMALSDARPDLAALWVEVAPPPPGLVVHAGGRTD